MSTTALINPNMITWARNRASLGTDVLARKLHVAEDKLLSWEDGEKYPTFLQAQKIAKTTFIPFGYLFLSEPPQEEPLPIPDLRTLDSSRISSISLELRDTLQTALTRVSWFKEYLLEQGKTENNCVGKLRNANEAKLIANDIKQTLGLSDYPERGNASEYLRALIQAIEHQGIMVLMNGIVGNNTHRPLRVEEFRGFAIADRLAPLIFINAADGPQPRLFTLIHELTHLWIGQSGVSDANPNAHISSEQLCNAVAGEFLVPEDEFFNIWHENNDFNTNISLGVSHFKVSQWVIARRALHFNIINASTYNSFIRELREEYENRDSSGGHYWNTQGTRLGKLFAQAVTSEALSGHLLLRDAARLLDAKPNQIKRIYDTVMA